MPSFWSRLFKRPAPRHFARLDNQGICLALREGFELPAGSGWVEVCESRLHWLSRPLPANARVARHTGFAAVQPRLAA